MNVQKMLNIFILLFVLINAVLYYVNDQQSSGAFQLTQSRQQQLIQILRDNDIEVETTQLLDTVYSPKRRLIIRGEVFNSSEKDIRARLMSEDLDDLSDPKYSDNDHIHENVDGTIRLTFHQGDEKGRIYYRATEPTYVPEDYTTASYDQLVNQFVQDVTLDNEGFELTDKRMRMDEDFQIYYFNERYENELLFCNEVVVKLEEQVGITEAKAIRYEPFAFEGDVTDLYPLDEVLYRLMFHIKEVNDKPVRISSIEIGYDFGPDGRNDLISMTVEPYYRVKLTSGDVYYVNAFTNEIRDN